MALTRLFSTILLSSILFFSQMTAAQNSRPELSALYTPEKIAEILPAPGQWNPFPRFADRAFWQGLPQAAIEDQIKRAEKLNGQSWPALTASLYLEFSTIGNRSNYEAIHYARRYRVTDMVLAECMEGKGRFINDIVDGLWLIMEESSWSFPAHVGAQKAGRGLPDINEPIVALFSAETASMIAWTLYLIEDQLNEVSPLIVPRCKQELKERILDPCLERDDFWWMGFKASHINNWNPWVNSNWLSTMLLIENDPQRRVDAVSKILRSLDLFTGSYHDDGWMRRRSILLEPRRGQPVRLLRMALQRHFRPDRRLRLSPDKKHGTLYLQGAHSRPLVHQFRGCLGESLPFLTSWSGAMAEGSAIR